MFVNHKLMAISTYTGQSRRRYKTMDLDRTYTVGRMLDTIKSLIDPTDPGHTEYARGMCELIGRLILDHHGSSADENALKIANFLKVRIYQ